MLSSSPVDLRRARCRDSTECDGPSIYRRCREHRSTGTANSSDPSGSRRPRPAPPAKLAHTHPLAHTADRTASPSRGRSDTARVRPAKRIWARPRRLDELSAANIHGRPSSWSRARRPELRQRAHVEYRSRGMTPPPPQAEDSFMTNDVERNAREKIQGLMHHRRRGTEKPCRTSGPAAIDRACSCPHQITEIGVGASSSRASAHRRDRAPSPIGLRAQVTRAGEVLDDHTRGLVTEFCID